MYRVYDFENDQHFFQVLVDGENSLIMKQRVRYIDAKVANTGYDTAFTNGGSERMRITSSGKVGIGTDTPTEKLEINNINIFFPITIGKVWLR